MARPYAHGSVSGAEWVDEAVVLIPISVYRNRSTKGEWLSAHQRLTAAFTAVGPTAEVCELRFEWGGVEYVMFGKPAQVKVDAENAAVGKSHDQCAFVASDPRVYSASLSSAVLSLPVQQGGLTVPLTLPTTIGGVLVGGRATLTNDGLTASGLTARIDGPVVEPAIILQRPDGSTQSVRFGLTLLSGQWLEVDSTTRTAYLNGSRSANQRPRTTWRMDFFPVLPGTTKVRFAAGEYDEDASLSLSTRSAWF
jgi:hypothetical protein